MAASSGSRVVSAASGPAPSRASRRARMAGCRVAQTGSAPVSGEGSRRDLHVEAHLTRRHAHQLGRTDSDHAEVELALGRPSGTLEAHDLGGGDTGHAPWPGPRGG